MVDDLLEMSALRSGDVELRREPFCPAQIFRSAEENASGRAQAARLNLNASLAPELEKTYLGSPSFMRQIVVNVLDNAVRYNVAGGGVQLTAGYREEASEAGVAGTPFLTLAVADTGRGMDPEQLARLFEPFAQEENDVRSVYPGSGLGMSITKALVDLMGGSIGVTSEPGRGTVVEAAIPLTPAGDEKGKAGSDAPRIRAAGTGATSPVAAGAPAEAPLSHEATIAGVRVLIAEDNDLNSEILQCLVEQASGVVVGAARDGLEAVRMFCDLPVGSVDVILMDVMMPRMDGYGATRAIRGLDRPDAGTVAIIAVTAKVFARDREKALAAGMNDHLSKPVDPADLVAAINRWK